MQGGFKAKNLKTHRELEFELDANEAKSENQAEIVPGPDLETRW